MAGLAVVVGASSAAGPGTAATGSASPTANSTPGAQAARPLPVPADLCEARGLVLALREAAPEVAEATLPVLDARPARTPTARGCSTVLTAHTLRAARGPAAAAQWLEPRAARLPRSFRGLAFAWLAERWLDAGDAPAASRAIAQARATARGAGEEQDQLARDLLILELRAAAGEPGRVLQALDTWAGKSKDPEHLAARAAALRALGKAGEADAAERSLLVLAPAHPAARALEPKLDDGRLPLGPGQLTTRVQGLIATSRLERALLETSRAVAVVGPEGAPRPLDVELELEHVRALVKNDRSADAAARAEVLHGLLPDDARVLEALAWSLGKARRIEEASAAYARLVEVAASREQAGEACFLSAFLAYEADLHDEAERRFAACEPRLVGHKREVDNLWYPALIRLSRGQPAAAVAPLRRLLDEKKGDREEHKFRYWLARALLESGDEAGGRKELQSLTRSAPLDYYGLLARRRLGLPPLKGAAVAADALQREGAHDPPARRSRLLFQLGFDDAARASVRDRRARNAGTLGLAQELGDSFLGFRHGYKTTPWPQVVKDGVRASAGWRASYAAPWPDLVDGAARTHAVPASFVYAIMRTESGFDPRATSRVGARGLLQLMPYSARGVAERTGRPAPSADELYEPAVSIDLGTAFLGISLREFGHTSLSAACYNAGPRHVASWMERLGHLEPELFVERVPFRETRDYIKKTAATAALYRGLAGEPVELDLPKGPVGPPPASYTWFPPTNNE